MYMELQIMALSPQLNVDMRLCHSAAVMSPPRVIPEYLDVESFPDHIKRLVQREKEAEEHEKRQREIERNTCKVFWPEVTASTLALLISPRMCEIRCVSVRLADQAAVHTPGEDDDDGEQAGGAQGQDSERGCGDCL